MDRSVLVAILLTLGTVACGAEAPTVAACVSPAPLVGVDHVTLAVHDLDAVRAQMQDLGFRIKEGRLHPNGIRNAHVKTSAGSLELLTVSASGTPDELSVEYEDFLAKGEGGAFLALGGAPVDSVAARLDVLGIKYNVERLPAWDYLTFPPSTALRHVYFFAKTNPIEESDSLRVHLNGASRVSAVVLDGSQDLMRVLDAIGAVVCEEDGNSTLLRLGDVDLTIVRSAMGIRGRVQGLEFQVYTSGRVPAEVSGLTIWWAPPT